MVEVTYENSKLTQADNCLGLSLGLGDDAEEGLSAFAQTAGAA